MVIHGAARFVTNALARLDILARPGVRALALPMVILYVTSRCNSRCISCGWWRAEGGAELTLEEIRSLLLPELRALRTRRVVFSGGEPLLRDEVYELARLFRAQGMAVELLTNGLNLERDAEQVAEQFASVTVSLDGHTPALYQLIRGVDGLEAVERGVARLRRLRPQLPIRARCVLQRHNYRYLPELMDQAATMGMAQISFLAADLRGEAYGRAPGDQLRDLLLDEEQVRELAQIVEHTIRSRRKEFESHRLAESAQKLRRLPQYYAAQLGLGAFPPVACNAPWVSAVIEADGAVRPCFFHRSVGNLRDVPLRRILAEEMAAFRAGLDVRTNPVCACCVCSLKGGRWTLL